jgi:hypothetical protein
MSFFPRTVRDWNLLAPDIVELDTPEAFKARIENHDYRNVSWEMICIYDLTLSKMRRGNLTHALSEARG